LHASQCPCRSVLIKLTVALIHGTAITDVSLLRDPTKATKRLASASLPCLVNDQGSIEPCRIPSADSQIPLHMWLLNMTFSDDEGVIPTLHPGTWSLAVHCCACGLFNCLDMIAAHTCLLSIAQNTHPSRYFAAFAPACKLRWMP
jgi:hypothetical protein